MADVNPADRYTKLGGKMEFEYTLTMVRMLSCQIRALQEALDILRYMSYWAGQGKPDYEAKEFRNAIAKMEFHQKTLDEYIKALRHK